MNERAAIATSSSATRRVARPRKIEVEGAANLVERAFATARPSPRDAKRLPRCVW